MTPAIDDQVAAAVAQARRGFDQALGLPPDRQTRSSYTAFGDELWHRYAKDPRCQHLQARPIQPSYWTAPTGWLCARCVQSAAQARRALGPGAMPLGHFEEFTCDRCRRYSRSELIPAVIRQDLWVMSFGFCQRCADDFVAEGAQLSDGAS
jgi:hypothetical protein